MFNREKLRELGASVIADLGHAPTMSKPRRAAVRRSSGAEGTAQATEKQGKALAPASTSSTIDTPDNVSTCTASNADPGEIQDSQMDSDKETWGTWMPPAPTQPLQPRLASPSCLPFAGVRPAGERRASWECATPAQGNVPWPAQDYMGGLQPVGWGPDLPAWVSAQEAMPSYAAVKGPHEPTAAPMYVRIPGLERGNHVSRPR